MAETVRRDIILKIRTESDLTQIDRTISRLDDLDRLIQRLNSRTRINVKTGTAGAASELGKIRKEAEEISRSDAARNLSKGMAEFERQTGRAVEGMRVFKREFKTTAAGDVRSTIFSRGPLGSGLSFKKTQETGANTFTLDEARAAKERDAFIKSRQQVRIAAERELEKIREGIRKHDQQMASQQERAIRDDVIRTKKRADEVGRVQERAIRDDITRTKKLSAEQAAIFDRASSENRFRDRSAVSFNRIGQLPGVTEQLGPQRVGRSGNLVQDRVLVDQMGNQVARLNAETGKATVTMGRFGKETEHTGDTLQSAAAKVLLWTAATGAIFGAVRAIRAGAAAFSEAEAGTISLERVGRGFGSTQDEIAAGAQFVTQEILRQSVALGQDTAEAQEAAVVFARLGLSQRETAEATRVAMLAANVAGIGAAQAAQLLASAMSQFQLNASDLPDLLDKLNTLENTTRVRTEDLLQAISRGGAVFREAGGTFEEFAAITAVVAESTSRSGAEIGNAFKTIASRLADPNLQGKILKETGINVRTAMGDLIPITELMGDLVVKFVELSQAEQAELTTQIAGIRQRNILQTSLDNFFKTQSQVIEQLVHAGSAEKENERILTQLDVKLKQLAASFERLAVAVGDSGVGKVLKKLVDLITFVVDSFASMGTAGAVVIAMIVGYIGAIVAASIWTSKLSHSTGILAGSYNALTRGAQAVNGWLAQTTGLMIGQARAADMAAAANARLAAAQAAGTVTRHTGFSVAQQTVGQAVGSGILSFMKGPAGILIGVTIGAAIVNKIADSFRTKSVFDESTDAFRSRQRDERASQAASNTVKAEETRIKSLSTIQGLLASIEDQESKGQAISVGASRAKAQAFDFLRKSVKLTADELAKLNAEALKSGDVGDIIARSEAAANAARDAEKSSLQNRVSTIDSQLDQLSQEAIERELSSTVAKKGIPLLIDPVVRSEGEIEKDVNELLKQREELTREIADIEKGELEQTIRRQLVDAEKRTSELIKQLQLEREIAENRASVFEVDDEDRARNRSRFLGAQLESLKGNLEKPGVDREKIGEEIDKVGTELRKAQEDIGKAQDKRQLDQIRENLKSSLESRLEQAKIENEVGNEYERQLKTLREQQEILNKELASSRKDSEIPPGGKATAGTAATKELSKDVEARIARTKVEIELEERRFRQSERRRAFEREETNRRRIGDALVGLEAAGGEPETRGIREAGLLIRNAQREVDALQAKIQALKAEAGGDTEARRDQIGFAEQALQDASERLEERKLDLIVEQIEAAKRLTEERQRQIEQTRKEIAGMSDLDLLRTRILAGRIGRGDLGQISQETFLGLDQETRRQLVRQGELFPGAKVAPDLDLGLGPGAFQRQIPGLPTPADLQQLFQNLNIMAPAEFRGAIQNAVLHGQNITIQRADGGGGVPEAAAAVQATFNFSGLEVPMDRLVNLLGLEFESRMQAIVASKIEAGERAVNRPAGYRPARVG